MTTLGRGGSDTTAVALAAALDAEACEIYSDVDGVFTADPRVVPEARKLAALSYDEMQELAEPAPRCSTRRRWSSPRRKGIAILAAHRARRRARARVVRSSPAPPTAA